MGGCTSKPKTSEYDGSMDPAHTLQAFGRRSLSTKNQSFDHGRQCLDSSRKSLENSNLAIKLEQSNDALLHSKALLQDIVLESDKPKKEVTDDINRANDLEKGAKETNAPVGELWPPDDPDTMETKENSNQSAVALKTIGKEEDSGAEVAMSCETIRGPSEVPEAVPAAPTPERAAGTVSTDAPISSLGTLKFIETLEERHRSPIHSNASLVVEQSNLEPVLETESVITDADSRVPNEVLDKLQRLQTKRSAGTEESILKVESLHEKQCQAIVQNGASDLEEGALEPAKRRYQELTPAEDLVTPSLSEFLSFGVTETSHNTASDMEVDGVKPPTFVGIRSAAEIVADTCRDSIGKMPVPYEESSQEAANDSIHEVQELEPLRALSSEVQITTAQHEESAVADEERSCAVAPTTSEQLELLIDTTVDEDARKVSETGSLITNERSSMESLEEEAPVDVAIVEEELKPSDKSLLKPALIDQSESKYSSMTQNPGFDIGKCVNCGDEPVLLLEQGCHAEVGDNKSETVMDAVFPVLEPSEDEEHSDLLPQIAEATQLQWRSCVESKKIVQDLEDSLISDDSPSAVPLMHSEAKEGEFKSNILQVEDPRVITMVVELIESTLPSADTALEVLKIQQTEAVDGLTVNPLTLATLPQVPEEQEKLQISSSNFFESEKDEMRVSDEPVHMCTPSASQIDEAGRLTLGEEGQPMKTLESTSEALIGAQDVQVAYDMEKSTEEEVSQKSMYPSTEATQGLKEVILQNAPSEEGALDIKNSAQDYSETLETLVASSGERDFSSPAGRNEASILLTTDENCMETTVGKITEVLEKQKLESEMLSKSSQDTGTAKSSLEVSREEAPIFQREVATMVVVQRNEKMSLLEMGSIPVKVQGGLLPEHISGKQGAVWEYRAPPDIDQVFEKLASEFERQASAEIYDKATQTAHTNLINH